MMTEDAEIPRRTRMDQWTPAERAIHDATQVVEQAGAHPLLTDAVILLGKARDKVADYVDEVQPEPSHAERVAMRVGYGLLPELLDPAAVFDATDLQGDRVHSVPRAFYEQLRAVAERYEALRRALRDMPRYERRTAFRLILAGETVAEREIG